MNDELKNEALRALRSARWTINFQRELIEINEKEIQVKEKSV